MASPEAKESKNELTSHIFVNLSKIKSLLLKDNNPDMIVDEQGNSLLQKAVVEGCCKRIVKYLAIERGANVSYQNINGETALHLAVKHRRYTIIKVLLSINVDCELKDKRGHNPFHKACQKGDFKLVDMLILKSLSVNCVDSMQNTPLHIVCTSNNDNVLSIVDLIHSYLDEDQMDTKNVLGESVLHIACRHQNNTAVLEYFLKTDKYDVNSQNDKGQTPLHYCIMNSSPVSTSLMVLLIYKCADVMLQDVEGHTSISRGILKNSSKIARFLTKAFHPMKIYYNTRGYFPRSNQTLYDNDKLIDFFLLLQKHDISKLLNMQDLSGDTVLHCICNNDYDLSTYVITHLGADVNVQNDDGDTPLHIAAADNNENVAHLCLRHEAKFDIKNKENQTALTKAFLMNNEQVTQKILFWFSTKNFEKPNITECIPMHQNGYGNTLLHYASSMILDGIVKHLIGVTKSVNVQNKKGYTPLHKACDRRDKGSYLKSFNAYRKDEFKFNELSDAHNSKLSNIINTLIKAGSDLCIQNTDGFSPLYLAFNTSNYVALAALLTSANFNPEQKMCSVFGNINDIESRNKYGDTIFLAVCKYNAPMQAIEYLIEQGSDIYETDAFGLKPIHIAVTNANTELLTFLLDSGELINISSQKGNLIQIACRYLDSKDRQHQAVVNTLLERGIDVNSKHPTTETTLYTAMFFDKFEFLEMLLQANADVNAKSLIHTGDTLLHVACKKYLKFIPLLIKYGANINATNISKSTPIMSFFNNTVLLSTANVATNEMFIKTVLKIMVSAGSKPTNVWLVSHKQRLKEILGRSVDTEFLYHLLLLGIKFEETNFPYTHPDYDKFLLEPYSLKDSCARVIRTSLLPNAWTSVSSIRLPLYLQNYITLNHQDYFHEYRSMGYNLILH